jgi:glutamate racemase
MKERPLGIFDSGIGGLTVLKEITRLLPQEETIYLGDTARVPYGTKSKETVVRYSLETADFLLKHNIKLLVVACNTASAYALPALKERLKIPVVGVIEPGAKMAVGTTRTKSIGVIGTEGTMKSGAYFDAIKAVDHTVVVFMKACPLFVPLAEEGWTDNDAALLTAKKYLEGFKEQRIDTLVLGCTHYPLLKGTIAKVMGGGVKLIDSAFATAFEVQVVLQDSDLLRKGAQSLTQRRFFVTDSPERFTNGGKRVFSEVPLNAELVRVEG